MSFFLIEVNTDQASTTGHMYADIGTAQRSIARLVGSNIPLEHVCISYEPHDLAAVQSVFCWRALTGTTAGPSDYYVVPAYNLAAALRALHARNRPFTPRITRTLEPLPDVFAKR